MISATLVAASTLFTKQHYVLDVIAGGFLAFIAYTIFLRRYPTDQIPDFDRRAAPTLALCVSAVVGVGFVVAWFIYLGSSETVYSGIRYGWRAR